MDDGGVPFELGLIRERLPDPESVGEDEALVARIREEIDATGPITFARFMERALYEPGHGYYRRSVAGPGRSGDFLTAPETHPLFGAAIGRLLEQAWDAMGRPSPFSISEPGAGTGALAAGLLGGLRDLGSPLFEAVRYRPMEVEDERLAAIRDRLSRAALADRLSTDLTPVHGETGAVVANEVLDALPVHRVIGRDGGLRELLVEWRGDRFAQVEGPLTDPRLAGRLAAERIEPGEGQVTEVCLGVEPWLVEMTSHVERGIVVLVDYAEEPAELHGPRHRSGTLRAFARHAVGGDPYRHVGRQDLTATVDLAAVRAGAVRAGLDPLGETTQAELLAAVGSGELVQAFQRRPGVGLAEALELRSALLRLMDTRGMGAFRVLAFGRGLPPGTTLPGMARLGGRSG